MKVRVVTVTIWFYVAWYTMAMVAGTLGLPAILGPIVGAIVATGVAIGLRRLPSTKTQVGDPAG